MLYHHPRALSQQLYKVATLFANYNYEEALIESHSGIIL